MLHFITWGGGGWGDPLQRDPANWSVKEVAQGLVTVGRSASAYGVVAIVERRGGRRRDGSIAHRDDFAPIGTALGSVRLMARDIETLRANCEAETGLPAPSAAGVAATLAIAAE